MGQLDKTIAASLAADGQHLSTHGIDTRLGDVHQARSASVQSPAVPANPPATRASSYLPTELEFGGLVLPFLFNLRGERLALSLVFTIQQICWKSSIIRFVYSTSGFLLFKIFQRFLDLNLF